MSLSTATIVGLALQCAPNIAPQTVLAIVRTESRGDPLALNVNGARQPGTQPTVADAIATAERHVAAGYSVDLGLGQINSRNMVRLGLTWETVFDPCANIAALGRVLSENYRAVSVGRHPQTALRLALSMYNTGSRSRGFRNGYVAKVISNAGTTDTAARHYDDSQRVAAASETQVVIAIENDPSRVADAAPRFPPSWNVFEHAAYVRTALAQPTDEIGTLLWTR